MKLSKLFQIGKKGMSLSDAPSLIIILVVIGIVGALGLAITAGIADSGSFTGDAANALGNITLAIANFFSLTPVLGTIFIAIILLAGVVGLLMWQRNRM